MSKRIKLLLWGLLIGFLLVIAYKAWKGVCSAVLGDDPRLKKPL